MRLDRVWLTDLRSYASAEIELAPGLTALLGDNGEGKTNVLEAISWLATMARLISEAMRANQVARWCAGAWRAIRVSSGTVASNPAGIACPGDCAEPYAQNSVVVLSATPSAGSSFTGWSRDCTGSATSVTVSRSAHAATTQPMSHFLITT